MYFTYTGVVLPDTGVQETLGSQEKAEDWQ